MGTGGQVTDGGIILKTTDGGLSWQTNRDPASIYAKAVFFTDTLCGFVVGSNPPYFNSVIMSTKSGVESWNSDIFAADALGLVLNKDFVKSFYIFYNPKHMDGDTAVGHLNDGKNFYLYFPDCLPNTKLKYEHVILKDNVGLPNNTVEEIIVN